VTGGATPTGLVRQTAGLPNVMSRRLSFFFAAVLFAITPAAFAYRISAWIPPWDSNALTSIQANGGAITESNPVWYSLNADGSIAKNWNAENSAWRAAMTGSQIIPTLQNLVNRQFDGATTASLLSTAQSRESHASAITQLVVANTFDGIDIDYEGVPTASRANFTAFLTTLSRKLHAANKKLSVAVLPKTSDSQNWDGRGSQDWNAIGQVADSVKIMAYDHSWPTSPAGPITPLDWLDKVASYATSTIPAAKVMIGLPWYGYDWVGTSGKNVTYASAMQTAQTNGATITHDVDGEATFTYSGHTVFFQDASSYQKKIDVLTQKHPTIGGFAHWAVGVEDPGVWPIIRSSSRGRRRDALH
jgi:spore germination protein